MYAIQYIRQVFLVSMIVLSFSSHKGMCATYQEIAKTTYFPTTNFKSSFPYITGATVRQNCNHILDPITQLDPYAVKAGDTIFVLVDFLDYFFTECHPRIQDPYILVTHHFYGSSDASLPGAFAYHLDDPKLIAWFTHNIDKQHPKLYSIPIGIGDTDAYAGNKSGLCEKYKDQIKDKTRQRRLLYMNFMIATYPIERQHVYDLFKAQPFCTVEQQQHKPVEQFFIDLLHHKFVLSPRGNGLDCFRTWEALLMGCYPIVRTSMLDPLFEGLPVVIINEWEEVTQSFLERMYEEFSKKEYDLSKAYLPYWLDKIKILQQPYRR